MSAMWPNSLGGSSGCGGGAGTTDLGGLAAASTASASDLFGPAGFGPSAGNPYGALKTSPYVGALGMPPIEALHGTIGYPGCSATGESYYCEFIFYLPFKLHVTQIFHFSNKIFASEILFFYIYQIFLFL